MISAVTPKGALRFAVFEGTTTAKTFVAFCKRLRRLQKLHGLVRAFFADPHLRYITAAAT